MREARRLLRQLRTTVTMVQAWDAGGTAPSLTTPWTGDRGDGGRRSTRGLSPWERWLELTAQIDGFPRHLSIHVGGMLVTRRR